MMSRCWISWAWWSWCNCLSQWALKRIRSRLFWWMRARRMRMLMRKCQQWKIMSWEWKRCWLWFHESKFFFSSFFLLLTHRFFHIATLFSLFFFSRSLVLLDQQRTRCLHTACMQHTCTQLSWFNFTHINDIIHLILYFTWIDEILLEHFNSFCTWNVKKLKEWKEFFYSILII